jgi:transposase
MILDITNIKIFVRTGPTDMRKQINGLSIIVESEMELNPFEPNVFLFCNKPRNRLKILYWDKNGFCLWLKRLEKDKFPWPRNQKDVREISREDLRLLLAGIDFWGAHKKLTYTNVS